MWPFSLEDLERELPPSFDGYRKNADSRGVLEEVVDLFGMYWRWEGDAQVEPFP